MKKYLILTILFLVTLTGIPFAGTVVNIVNDDPNVDIYINGVKAGRGSVSDWVLEQGEHHIKVVSGQDVIYSKMIKINDEKIKTINTSHFVDAPLTNIANKGSTQTEAKRIRAARGDYAIGFYGSDSMIGVNLKYFLFSSNIGVQAIVWGNSTVAETNECFLIRPVIELSDNILWGRHINTYAAFGIGSRRVKNSTVDRSDQIYQGVVGIEGTSAVLGVPMALASVILVAASHKSNSTGFTTEETIMLLAGLGGLVISVLPNAYADLEFGYEKTVDNQGNPKSGIMGAAGVLFYF